MIKSTIACRLSADLAFPAAGTIPFDQITSTGLTNAGPGQFNTIKGDGVVTINYGVRTVGDVPIQLAVLKNGEAFKYVNILSAGQITGTVLDTDGKRDDHYDVKVGFPEGTPEGGVTIIGDPLFTYLDISGDLS